MAVTMVRKYANRPRKFLKSQEVLGPIIAELQDYMENVGTSNRGLQVSFETGEQGAIKVYFDRAVLLQKVRLQVVKPLAATDAGTVTLKDSSGNTLGTPASFPASTVFGTEATITPTAPFAVAAGGYVTLTTAKTTAGGKVLAYLSVDASPTLT